MAACEGFSQIVATGHLAPCPYDALWDHGGHRYCFFHLEVAKGFVESSCWRPTDRAAAEPESDRLLLLMQEWDLA